jgi:hypothetical protein
LSSDHNSNSSVSTTFPSIEIAKKGKELPEGFNALDSKALTILAKINSMENETLEVKLDSGADITLLSENYWTSLQSLPKPKTGMRMCLYHLTGEAKILGYIKFPVFTQSTDGTWIQFDTEAYVVRNMNTPLLLGEDSRHSLNCLLFVTTQVLIESPLEAYLERLMDRPRKVLL